MDSNKNCNGVDGMWHSSSCSHKFNDGLYKNNRNKYRTCFNFFLWMMCINLIFIIYIICVINLWLYLYYNAVLLLLIHFEGYDSAILLNMMYYLLHLSVWHFMLLYIHLPLMNRVLLLLLRQSISGPRRVLLLLCQYITVPLPPFVLFFYYVKYNYGYFHLIFTAMLKMADHPFSQN